MVIVSFFGYLGFVFRILKAEGQLSWTGGLGICTDCGEYIFHEGQKSSDKEKYYFEVGNFNMLYRFFVKTKLLKIFDALLSLTKRKDRILLQDLYKK